MSNPMTWQTANTAPKNINVLVSTVGGITIAHLGESLAGEIRWYKDGSCSPFRGNISHWMHLPQQPSEDNDAI